MPCGLQMQMSTRIFNFKIIFAGLIIGMSASSLVGETLYVDGMRGDDRSPGTKDEPFKTISKAVAMVNSSSI